MPAGIFALSINPAYEGPFPLDAFWGTEYQQHFSEDYGGFAFLQDSKLFALKPEPGLFRSGFEEAIKGLSSDVTEAVGYCGPAAEPPSPLDTKLGRVTGCFSGNVTNCPELVGEFKAFGHTFSRVDDMEVILKRIAQGADVPNGILSMKRPVAVEGSYALVVMSEKQGGMYAVSYPGHWPLIVGVKKGAVALATDPAGFRKLGFVIERELNPGEIVFLKKGVLETCGTIPGAEGKVCGFLFWYSASPGFSYKGVVAADVREASGALLAKRDIESGFIPDMVASVPYSGDHHARGYMQEFCRAINDGRIKRVPLPGSPLLRYPYAGRSFTPQDEKARQEEAHYKQLPNPSKSFIGLIVRIIDDSIVRGNQFQQDLVPMLRGSGFREVWAGISYAEIVRGCLLGKAAKDDGELAANRFPDLQKRRAYLGLKGLDYNEVADVIAVLASFGLLEAEVCLDCIRRRV